MLFKSEKWKKAHLMGALDTSLCVCVCVCVRGRDNISRVETKQLRRKMKYL